MVQKVSQREVIHLLIVFEGVTRFTASSILHECNSFWLMHTIYRPALGPPGLPVGLGGFFWGGGGGTWGGEHSIEDHYLHINGIIFWGGVANFWWGDSPPPQKKNRPPGNPESSCDICTQTGTQQPFLPHVLSVHVKMTALNDRWLCLLSLTWD